MLKLIFTLPLILSLTFAIGCNLRGSNNNNDQNNNHNPNNNKGNKGDHSHEGSSGTSDDEDDDSNDGYSASGAESEDDDGDSDSATDSEEDDGDSASGAESEDDDGDKDLSIIADLMAKPSELEPDQVQTLSDIIKNKPSLVNELVDSNGNFQTKLFNDVLLGTDILSYPSLVGALMPHNLKTWVAAAESYAFSNVYKNTKTNYALHRSMVSALLEKFHQNEDKDNKLSSFVDNPTSWGLDKRHDFNKDLLLDAAASSFEILSNETLSWLFAQLINDDKKFSALAEGSTVIEGVPTPFISSLLNRPADGYTLGILTNFFAALREASKGTDSDPFGDNAIQQQINKKIGDLTLKEFSLENDIKEKRLEIKELIDKEEREIQERANLTATVKEAFKNGKKEEFKECYQKQSKDNKAAAVGALVEQALNTNPLDNITNLLDTSAEWGLTNNEVIKQLVATNAGQNVLNKAAKLEITPEILKNLKAILDRSAEVEYDTGSQKGRQAVHDLIEAKDETGLTLLENLSSEEDSKKDLERRQEMVVELIKVAYGRNISDIKDPNRLIFILEAILNKGDQEDLKKIFTYVNDDLLRKEGDPGEFAFWVYGNRRHDRVAKAYAEIYLEKYKTTAGKKRATAMRNALVKAAFSKDMIGNGNDGVISIIEKKLLPAQALTDGYNFDRQGCASGTLIYSILAQVAQMKLVEKTKAEARKDDGIFDESSAFEGAGKAIEQMIAPPAEENQLVDDELELAKKVLTREDTKLLSSPEVEALAKAIKESVNSLPGNEKGTPWQRICKYDKNGSSNNIQLWELLEKTKLVKDEVEAKELLQYE